MTHQKLFDHMSQEIKDIAHDKAIEILQEYFVGEGAEELDYHEDSIIACYTDEYALAMDTAIHTANTYFESSINSKLTELKNNIEAARIAHNCATGITKKNIGISMTCTEYAISVLKELVE